MLVANLKRTNFMDIGYPIFFTVLRLYTQTRLNLQVYAFNLDTTFPL